MSTDKKTMLKPGRPKLPADKRRERLVLYVPRAHHSRLRAIAISCKP